MGSPARQSGKDAGKRRATAKKQRPLLEPLSEGGEHEGNSAFARALGSVDFLTRERGVQALTRLLQRKTDITELDMLKLWKGLYFCFWHSDKTPVQTELAERLAGVLGSLSQPVAWLYFTVFFTTMRREWFSIDRLRLDKFLMLIRKFLSHMFLYLKKHEWQDELVGRCTQWLQAHVLLPTLDDPHRAVGLAYHLADIYIPELRKVLAADAPVTPKGKPVEPLPPAIATQLLQPFVATLQRAGEDALINRVKEAVFEPLVEEVRGDADEEEGAGSGLLGGALSPAEFAARLFELGASPDVRARNRNALYGLSKELETAVRKRAKRDEKRASQAGQEPGAQAKPSRKRGKQDSVEDGQQGPAMEVTAQPEQHLEPTSGKKKRKGSAAAAAATPELIVAQAAVSGAMGSEEDGTAAPTAVVSGRKRRTPGGVPVVSVTEPTNASTDVPAQGNGIGTPTSQGKTGKASKASVTFTNGPVAAAAPQQEQGKPAKSALKQGKGQAAAAAGPAAGEQQGPAAPATTTRATTAKKNKGNHDAAHVKWQDGAAGGASGPPTPLETLAAPASAKKSVRIDLKKNLFFAFGGPVPDPMVRTPPSSRSKGGILKKHALTAAKQPKRLHRLAGSQTAPPKVVTIKVRAGQEPTRPASLRQQQQQHGSGRKAVTPGSVPRVRAADLFA